MTLGIKVYNKCQHSNIAGQIHNSAAEQEARVLSGPDLIIESTAGILDILWTLKAANRISSAKGRADQEIEEQIRNQNL